MENQFQNDQTQLERITKNVTYNENENPGFKASVKLYLNDAFRLNKRMGRADYWWGQLGWSILITFLVFIEVIAVAVSIANQDVVSFFSYVYGFSLLITIIGIPSTTAGIRRLHDTGRSGWYILISLVPFLGNILFLILLCQPSVQFLNKWVYTESYQSEK